MCIFVEEKRKTMTKQNDPSFPFTWQNINGDACAESGLTKREYFAAKAMQGLLSIYDTSNGTVPNHQNTAYMAEISVLAADELIKQLNEQK